MKDDKRVIKVGVLVSGGGTNLQALIDAKDRGEMPSCEISVVVSSRSGVYALERAKAHGINTAVISPKDFNDVNAFSHALADFLQEQGVELVILAGFLTILGPEMVQRFPNAILNVHPALIPSFCGKGYYGLHVHEQALARGVKLTGATVHFVNEVADGGPIVLQKAVEVLDDDTPESLQKRVMQEAEWILLPRAAELFASGRLEICGSSVRIKESGGGMPGQSEIGNE